MKNKVCVVAALLLIVPLVAQLSFAQLLPNARWNTKRNRTTTQYQSPCPDGRCDTTQAVYQTQRTVTSQPRRAVQSSRHWTYPGNIDDHLRTSKTAGGHGVEPSGLTHEQKLQWHDALHEGRVFTPITPIIQQSETTIRVTQPAPQPVTRPTPQPQQRIIPASNSTFGLGVSTPIVKEPIPRHVLAQVGEPTRTEVRTEFKQSLLDAIAAARKADKITFRDAVKLRVACISPAFVERAQELAVTQLAFSGEASEHVPTEDGVIQVEGINWDGLAKFLEVFVPLLIQLIKAFGL